MTKFNSPASVGFLIVLAIVLFARLFLIGSLYLIAFGQMASPYIIQFVKDQIGSPGTINSFQELQSAFDGIGVVEEIRLLDKGEPDLRSDTILATEMVLGALKTPKRKASKVGEPAKIENRPRKYLTAREKLAEQNWKDRAQTTDWQDRDCWLA